MGHTYTPTGPFTNGGAPGISAAALNNIETGITNAQTDFNTHQASNPMDHVAGSATDTILGNRTVTDGTTTTTGTGTLTNLLTWIVSQIKAITGKTHWYDAPDTTIAALNTSRPKIGTGNMQTTPAITIIVVGPTSAALPTAGTLGRIAFVVPYTPS